MLSELRGYPAKAFAVSFLAYAFSQMDLALFGYAIPSIREEFGLSLQGVMSIVSSAFVLGGLLIVVLALFTDRMGRRRMFQASFVGASILITLHSIVPTAFLLAFLRGLSIAVGGLTYPITGAVISEEFPARYRGLFLGFLQIGYPLGWFVASLWAAWLLVDFGWRALFIVGLISIPFIFVINRTIREPRRFTEGQTRIQQGTSATPGENQKARISDLFAPDLRFRTITIFAAQYLFVWAYAGSIFLFPSFLSENRGFAMDTYSLFIGLGNLIGILGYILAALVGEFLLTRRDTVVIWTLTGAVLYQVLIWGPTEYWPSLLIYGLMSMFFYGAAAVKFAYIAEAFPTRVRATGIALSGSLAVTMGSASGPIMVSLAQSEWGWDVAMSVVVGLPLVAAGLLYFLLKPVPSGLEVEEVDAIMARRDPAQAEQS